MNFKGLKLKVKILMTTPKSICDECESEFFANISPMPNLCPNCSHFLYGYPNCDHQFEDGVCQICGWNGKVSDFIQQNQHK